MEEAPRYSPLSTSLRVEGHSPSPEDPWVQGRASYLSCSQQPVVGQTQENIMGIPGQKGDIDGEEESLVQGRAPFLGALGLKSPCSVSFLPFP